MGRREAMGWSSFAIVVNLTCVKPTAGRSLVNSAGIWYSRYPSCCHSVSHSQSIFAIREYTFILNRPPSFLHVFSETNFSKLHFNFSGSSTSSNTFKLYSAILLYNGLSSQICKGMTSSVGIRAGATGLVRNDMILRHEGSIGS